MIEEWERKIKPYIVMVSGSSSTVSKPPIKTVIKQDQITQWCRTTKIQDLRELKQRTRSREDGSNNMFGNNTKQISWCYLLVFNKTEGVRGVKNEEEVDKRNLFNFPKYYFCVYVTIVVVPMDSWRRETKIPFSL